METKIVLKKTEFLQEYVEESVNTLAWTRP